MLIERLKSDNNLVSELKKVLIDIAALVEDQLVSLKCM